MTIKAKLDIAVKALKAINNPIGDMVARLKKGERLSSAAYSISRDPEYLKRVARAALDKLGED